jgi:zinc/manganese transport system substrate-binding protein
MTVVWSTKELTFVRRIIPPALILALLTVSCSAASDPVLRRRPLVVATTSILGDVTASAFEGLVDVEVLIAGTQDPHSYRASPDQVGLIHAADLVVANGLGLEEALLDLLEAAAADGARVVYLGDVIDPIAGGEDHGEEDGHEEGDPHFWLDPLRMAVAVRYLGEQLAVLLPADAATVEAAAESYASRVEDVDSTIRRLTGSVPAPDRRLVTNHDSLAYFAAAYGYTILGTVIPGTSTLAEASASDLADLVVQMRSVGTPAIFVESNRPARLAEVVAEEVGHTVRVVRLYTGTLGAPGTGADTYIGLLRTNAELIVQALTNT